MRGDARPVLDDAPLRRKMARAVLLTLLLAGALSLFDAVLGSAGGSGQPRLPFFAGRYLCFLVFGVVGILSAIWAEQRWSRWTESIAIFASVSAIDAASLRLTRGAWSGHNLIGALLMGGVFVAMYALIGEWSRRKRTPPSDATEPAM